MWKTRNRNRAVRNVMIAASGTLGLGLMIINSGCSQPASPSADAAESGSSGPAVTVSESATTAARAIPAPDVPAEAPVLGEVYPSLTSGALKLARLIDLPGDRLLQAQGVSITQGDLDKEFSQVPAEAREEMRKNAFFIVEQKATTELLTAKARQRLGDASMPTDPLLQHYFEEVTRASSVTDAEVEAFYEENRELVGNAPFAQVKASIQGHLTQQKQQEAVEAHIAALGDGMTIAMDADWVKEHAALAMDNPIDKARASGKPTFVNFGSKGCRPCAMIEPIREDIKTAYGDRLNVVYVPVNQERLLASRYGVRGIPHLVFFDKDGKEVHTHTGFMPKEQIEAQIQSLGVQR